MNHNDNDDGGLNGNQNHDDNNNDDINNNHGEGENPVLIPERNRIVDEEEWLRINGLRPPEAFEGGDDDGDGDGADLNRREEVERYRELEDYQRMVHSRCFGDDASGELRRHEDRERVVGDSWWHDATIDFRVAGDAVVRGIPVAPLAISCDTIFAMATSWEHFSPETVDDTRHGGNGEVDDSGNHNGGGRVVDGDNDTGANNKNSNNTETKNIDINKRDDEGIDSGCKRRKKSMFLSLKDFPEATVRHFVDIVVHSKPLVRDVQPLGDGGKDGGGDAGETKTEVTTKEGGPDFVDELESVVDICQLAHYLQNPTLLDEAVQFLVSSINTENCLALCQLADELHIPALFESSLGHMMTSLEEIQDNADAWEILTPELQDRIATIQSAIQSSLHSQRSRLYFGSLQEYIAIFAERVQYYKERLDEAKEQQLALDHAGGMAWHDAQRKIDKQERRVRTLQTALKEQKKLFLSASTSTSFLPKT